MSHIPNSSLAELMICAAAEAWRDNGEVIASGIGTLPRIAAGLAKMTFAPELMMTDGEAYLVEHPVPVGETGEHPRFSGWMPYSRVFDIVWSGRRHAMIGPVQIDRYGQANISCIGDLKQPKAMMLGMRGLPGNSMCHINSMFVPNHNTRVFVEDEVDAVGSVGYNPKRRGAGENFDHVDLRLIVTNLCVLDFEGPDHAVRVRSLHPGVSFDEVQAATGFPLIQPDDIPTTALPTVEQMEVIKHLDPTNLRAKQIKGNPPAVREDNAA